MRKTIVAAAIAIAAGAGFASDESHAQTMNLTTYGLQFEELEYRRGEKNEDLFVFNGDAYVGTDELKLRWQGEGEYDLDAKVFEGLENRIVAQVPISTFFDAKAGVRFDTPDGPDRMYGVIGVAGLAPQWFEVDLDLFVSEKGDASSRVDLEYETLLTNRLILTTSADVDFAFSDDEEIGIGSGFSSAEVGARLSYDIWDRRVSPYLGVVYDLLLGDTARYAKNEGEDTGGWRFVVGTKIVF